MENPNTTIRLRVSPEVARIVAKNAPRQLKLEAARGEIPLSGRDLLTALFFLFHDGDPEMRSLSLATLRRLTPSLLAPLTADEELHPRLLDLIARVRLGDVAVLTPLLENPALPSPTLIHVAQRCSGELLALLTRNEERLNRSPDLVGAILANPNADRELKLRLGCGGEPEEEQALPMKDEGGTEDAGNPEGESGEDEGDLFDEGEVIPEEEINLSKYQMALEMGVSEKIKTAMTGDKEWRSIFLKDPNKLVSSAVMKNPRITEGEVLAVAKNKSSSEELIRLITLNQEWVKNYELKKALVMHPRTPLPKALRYMNLLGEKDLKNLSKSRSVSPVIVNNARRMLMAKEKRR